jgi:hypothetical protein
MPFCHSLPEFPARVEATRHHQNSSVQNECRFRGLGKDFRRGRTCGAASRLRHPDGGGANAVTENSRGESHDMYENEGTYSKNSRFSEKVISLITSLLAARLEMSQGKLKVKAKATMLQKTKKVESLDLIKATMLMKTKHLYF